LVIDELQPGLFPHAPVIATLPPGADVVYAVSVIRASRDLTEQHNNAKDKNIVAANKHIKDTELAYNAYLEERAVNCPKDEPEEPKKRGWLF
jgi:hypothetical protein